MSHVIEDLVEENITLHSKSNLPDFDQVGIACFSQAMQNRLKDSPSLADGKWLDTSTLSAPELADLLIESVSKGDAVEVANYCMMLYQRGAPASVLAEAVLAKAIPVGYELQVTNGWVKIEAERVDYFMRHGRNVRKVYTHPLPLGVAEPTVTKRSLKSPLVTVNHSTCRRACSTKRCETWCGDTHCSPDLQRIPEDMERRSPASIEMRVLTASLGCLERGQSIDPPRNVKAWDRRENEDRRKR